MQNILLLDNYDSFTYNLAHYIEAISGIKPTVFRNNEIDVADVEQFDALILSPGPGLPQNAGIMPELLKKYADKKKILGVCLGHQAIAEHFGAQLIRLKKVFHGVATDLFVEHHSCIFNRLPSEFKVGRYHSWVVDRKKLPETIKVLAIDEDKQIMAIKHVVLPIWGVQFHPESILSDYGKELLKNWITT